MLTRRSRQFLSITLLALASAGCAKPPSAEERVGVWLAQAPRTLNAQVKPDLPEPMVFVDHTTPNRIGRGVGGAALGAAAAVGGGCATFGPVGCMIGAMAAPFIGGGMGLALAVTTPTNVRYHPLSAIKGGEQLANAALVPAEVGARLQDALVAAAAKSGPRLRFAAPGEPAAPADGVVEFSINSLYFDSRTDPRGEDAEVLLVMSAIGTVNPSGPGDIAVKVVNVEGSKRLPMSEWSKDDAKLFREELAKVLDELAAKLVAALDGSRPSPTSDPRQRSVGL